MAKFQTFVAKLDTSTVMTKKKDTKNLSTLHFSRHVETGNINTDGTKLAGEPQNRMMALQD